MKMPPLDTGRPDSLRTYLMALLRRVARLERRHNPSGLWAPVGDPVEVKSATKSFNVASGQSLDADGEWHLQLRLLLATGTTHQVRVEPRGTIIDATNYSSESFRSGDTTVATISPNDQLQLGTFNAPNICRFDVRLSKRVGGVTLLDWTGAHASASGTPRSWSGAGQDLAISDITRLNVGSTVSNRILAGSEAQLFRKVK
jgi:hypothetical protein